MRQRGRGYRERETKAMQVRKRGGYKQEERNGAADFGTERGSALVSPRSVINC